MRSESTSPGGMSAAVDATRGSSPAESSPTAGAVEVGSAHLSDKGEDAETHANGLPVSFSGVFNTAVTADNVPTVLSKLQKWGDYESYGEPVFPSKFIPMKTPLSPTLLADLGVVSSAEKQGEEKCCAHVHTLPRFLTEQKSLNRDVGLVIDLSNHDCLYADGIPPDVERVHVRNVAKSIPDMRSANEVIEVAGAFWRRHPEKFISIHCAYGFNRTGFVLCCYLIEKCGLSASQALASFAAARHPGVKHERFREALQRRYPIPGCAPVERDDASEFADPAGEAAGDAFAGRNDGKTDLESGFKAGKENTETLDLDISVLDVDGAEERGGRLS